MAHLNRWKTKDKIPIKRLMEQEKLIKICNLIYKWLVLKNNI